MHSVWLLRPCWRSPVLISGCVNSHSNTPTNLVLSRCTAADTYGAYTRSVNHHRHSSCDSGESSIVTILDAKERSTWSYPFGIICTRGCSMPNCSESLVVRDIDRRQFCIVHRGKCDQTQCRRIDRDVNRYAHYISRVRYSGIEAFLRKK